MNNDKKPAIVFDFDGTLCHNIYDNPSNQIEVEWDMAEAEKEVQRVPKSILDFVEVGSLKIRKDMQHYIDVVKRTELRIKDGQPIEVMAVNFDYTLVDGINTYFALRKLKFNGRIPVVVYPVGEYHIPGIQPVYSRLNPGVRKYLDRRRKHFEVIILTARPESSRDLLRDWLIANRIHYDELIMKPDQMNVDDVTFKSGAVQNLLLEHDVWAVFDNDEKVIAKLIEKKIPAFHVKYEEFWVETNYPSYFDSERQAKSYLDILNSQLEINEEKLEVVRRGKGKEGSTSWMLSREKLQEIERKINRLEVERAYTQRWMKRYENVVEQTLPIPQENPSNILLTVPHSFPYFSPGTHLTDFAAEPLAWAIYANIKSRKLKANLKEVKRTFMLVGDRPRHLTDLNRPEAEKTSWYAKLKSIIEVGDTVLDVHSYPPTICRHKDWKRYDLVLIKVPGVTDENLMESVKDRLIEVGHRVLIATPEEQNWVQVTAKKEGAKTVLIELNEKHLYTRKMDEIADAIVEGTLLICNAVHPGGPIPPVLGRYRPKSFAPKDLAESAWLTFQQRPVDKVFAIEIETPPPNAVLLGPVPFVLYQASKWSTMGGPSGGKIIPSHIDLRYIHRWKKNPLWLWKHPDKERYYFSGVCKCLDVGIDDGEKPNVKPERLAIEYPSTLAAIARLLEVAYKDEQGMTHRIKFKDGTFLGVDKEGTDSHLYIVQGKATVKAKP